MMPKHTGKIERIVEACQNGARPRDIAKATGYKSQSVSEYLRTLVAQGRVRREGEIPFCVYYATGKPALKPVLTPEQWAARKLEQRRAYDKKRNAERRAQRAAGKPEPVLPRVSHAPRAHMPAAMRQAEPVITKQTRFIVCPSGRDTRYEADPSIAGRGAISQDWMRRQA
jgi:DNA-binding HxlR family transcriptional regulator